MNLANVARFWSNWQPDHECIVFEEQRISWRDFDTRANRLANGLAALGVAKGDRVGILSDNCVEYLELAAAGYKLGSVLVPLNVRLTPTELRYIIDDAGCTLVAADGAHASRAAAALDGSPNVERLGFHAGFGATIADARTANSTDPQAPLDANDLAYICYTSGTTGRPKGAMLSHGNVLAMANHRILAEDFTTATRNYLPFPLSFTGGLVSAWAPTFVAGATLILDAAVEPDRALRIMASERVSVLAAVPIIWQTLLQHPDFASTDLSALVGAASGGAAVPLPLLEQLQQAGIPMSQGYGLTEGAGMNLWLNARDAQRKVGSCGKPMMHTRARIIDPEADKLVDVPAGEVGELALSGPEIMLGYWNKPDATASTIVDGWLRTGDLARADDEGYYYIVDRAKDMLISGGLNVYPAEIESVLSDIDGVGECAVIGVPHEKWGETPAAIICPAHDACVTEAAIADFCREHLADYKRPRFIVLRDEPLPRGMSGKVLKRELREEYQSLAT